MDDLWRSNDIRQPRQALLRLYASIIGHINLALPSFTEGKALGQPFSLPSLPGFRHVRPCEAACFRLFPLE